MEALSLDKQFNSLEDGTFSSKQSPFQIYYKHYLDCEESEIYHFIFLHGAVEHHANHEDFFSHLRKKFKGKNIISTFDLIGHGLSGGPRSHVDDIEVYLQDALHFFEICKELKNEKNKKYILIGFSLGGLIGLSILLNKNKKIPLEFYKAIWISPCIKPSSWVPKVVVNMVRGLPIELQKIRLTNPIEGHDLTHSHKKAMKFNTDSLISKFVTIRMGLVIMEAAKKIAGLSYYLKTPSLFLISDNDKVVNSEAAKLFAYGVDKKYSKVVVYPEAKHDLLNENIAQSIYNEIEVFIKGK